MDNTNVNMEWAEVKPEPGLKFEAGRLYSFRYSGWKDALVLQPEPKPQTLFDDDVIQPDRPSVTREIHIELNTSWEVDDDELDDNDDLSDVVQEYLSDGDALSEAHYYITTTGWTRQERKQELQDLSLEALLAYIRENSNPNDKLVYDYPDLGTEEGRILLAAKQVIVDHILDIEGNRYDR